jgi:hypothetical protein
MASLRGLDQFNGSMTKSRIGIIFDGHEVSSGKSKFREKILNVFDSRYCNVPELDRGCPRQIVLLP